MQHAARRGCRTVSKGQDTHGVNDHFAAQTWPGCMVAERSSPTLSPALRATGTSDTRQGRSRPLAALLRLHHILIKWAFGDFTKSHAAANSPRTAFLRLVRLSAPFHSSVSRSPFVKASADSYTDPVTSSSMTVSITLSTIAQYQWQTIAELELLVE